MTALMPNPLFCPFSTTEICHASTAFQSRPRTLFHKNPPPARARRSEGSSTDTTPTPDAEGFVESDLRAGGPTLCESPCETIRNIPTSLENYDRFLGPGSFQLMTKLNDICRNDNVRPDHMEFCGRRSMYEPNQHPVLTLRVVAKRNVPSQTSNASVEIMDAKFEQSPGIYACVPSDRIFPIWKQVALQIFHQIDCRGVFTIGCFRIGNDNDRSKCPPTILLGVDRAVKRNWKPVRDTIVTILDNRGLFNVAVTIRKDNRLARANQIRSREGIPAADCRDDPNIGTSLSPSDREYEHGTLGGWVEVRNPENGNWVAFAITCAHCCFPEESSDSPEDLKAVQHWKQQGVRVGDNHKKRLLPVDSPSYRDVKSTLDRLADHIKESKSDDNYQEVERIRAEDGFVMPFLKSKWQMAVNEIAGYEKDRHNIKKFLNKNEASSRLGTVFAASGFREVSSTDDPNVLSLRDWALVRISPTRSVGNNRVTIEPNRQNKRTMLLNDFKPDLPKLGQQLFKVGRATGTTNGTYGNLKSCRIATRTVDGNEEYVPTFEHVMLADDKELIRQGTHVVAQGDSGSLVFDKTGSVLGIIFGGNGTENIGYFTATRDLISDIKHITGAQEIRIHGGSNQPQIS